MLIPLLFATAVATAPPPCPSSAMLSEPRFQPQAKRLPAFPECTAGFTIPPPKSRADHLRQQEKIRASPPWPKDGPAQCIYANTEYTEAYGRPLGVTWSRANSTDHLVRQENLAEYPPLAAALHALGGMRTVVDAGANDGLSTRLFALGMPEARVVSLEPALGNYAMVLHNTRDLGPRVTALRAALWNASMSVAVTAGPAATAGSEWSMSVAPSAASAGLGGGRANRDALPGISVDGLLDALCVQTIDFLKMGTSAGLDPPTSGSSLP